MTPEQLKQLEDEQRAAMQREQQQGLSFSLPNLGAIPNALANVGSSIVDAGKSLFRQASTQNDPVFKVRKLAETQSMIKELEALNKQEEALKAKYGDFNPLEKNLDEFQTLALSKIPGTPLTPWTDAEQAAPANMSMKASVKTGSSSARPMTPIPAAATEEATPVSTEPNYYDLATQANKPNTAYEEALRKQERGSQLAALLAGSAQAGRAIAGAGRLDASTDTFQDVANLYGDDRRVLDETAKRAEVEESLAAGQADSNISKAAQTEAAEMLKGLGQELKDPEALARMSAKQLAPILASLKMRKAAKDEKEDKEANRALAEQKYKDDLEDKKQLRELQNKQHQENVALRRELGARKEEDKKADKENTVILDQENKTKSWLSHQNDKMGKLKAQVSESRINAERLERLLKEPVNSVEQINQIYNFIKNLDNTAVREGEIKLFREGQNVFEELEVWKSRLTKNPQVISNKQFQRLAHLVVNQAKKTGDYYDKTMKDADAQFKVRAHRLLEKDPERYGSWVESLDQDYYDQRKKAAGQTPAPSQETLDKIGKRSVEENTKRLEELEEREKKYRNGSK